MITETFKIISHLKDILGRGLVTNEFVAVFELVKNGFDAGASSVAIEVDPEAGRIAIVDDGKGMARRDIIERWLFLAYSAKADNSEDDNLHPDYRDRIRQRDQFAGSKGIGRLSCDTLGTNLILYSRTFGETAVQKLSINWSDFEKDSKSEFGDRWCRVVGGNSLAALSEQVIVGLVRRRGQGWLVGLAEPRSPIH